MAAPLLEIDGLSVALARTGARVLDDVSLGLSAGEVLGIVGESGSGKSVLALSVMGLLPRALRIDAGSIRLGGAELTGGSGQAWRDRRGRDLAMIFQEPMTALNPVMRIGRQIGEVLVKRRGLGEAEARRETVRLLERVEIPDAARRAAGYPHELSGGMRQRVMIAIALAAEPKVLIADEPTTALDVTIQKEVLDLLRGLQRERGLALVLITHDLGVIAEMADRVMVLYAGRTAEVAPASMLFDAPRHPYTAALLASVPSDEAHGHRLASIDGAVPAVGAMPAGCRFAPRCARATPECGRVSPALASAGAGHEVACLNPLAVGGSA